MASACSPRPASRAGGGRQSGELAAGGAVAEQARHSVQVAINGREAVQALGKQRFDLVLMDAQMPEMDGMEVTAAIRQHEKSTGLHTPIIALTMKGDREKYWHAGGTFGPGTLCATHYAILGVR